MNPVAVAKFFNIICKAVLLSMFASQYRDNDLLEPVLIYFGIVETNSHVILHLHCLVWFKRVSHLSILPTKIRKNEEFYIKLLAFLEHIIKCSTNNVALFDVLHHICPNACVANTIKDFMAQPKEDNKAVAKKV